MARRVEELGFAGIWVTDAFGRGRPTIDPLVLLGRPVRRDRKIELGTCVVQIPLRHPVEHAHRVQSLNLLSQGRLRFGVGSGSTQADFDAVDADYARRFKTLPTYLETMRRTWNGETAISVWPGTEGGPPVLLGAWRSARWIDLAAHHCQGWIASGIHTSWEDLEIGLAHVSRGGRQARRAGQHLHRSAAVADAASDREPRQDRPVLLARGSARAARPACGARHRRCLAGRARTTIPASSTPSASWSEWTRSSIAIRAVVGASGLLTDAADTAPYAEDWRRLYQGRTPAVVRPADTAQLAAVMRLCNEHGIAVVPQGGNTSMVAGATPDADGRQLVVSTARMNRVRAIDPVDLTMTIEAGVTLKAAQIAAADAGCLLPLSISSEGSAQIGGVLATNAGGNNTLRYGNARDLVLGLEVVLPDGQVWNGLRRLRKDNTGYCLRQLFVGSEGTLGIITAGVLKLAPKPREIRGGAVRRAVGRRRRSRCSRRFQAHDPGAGAGVRIHVRHGHGVRAAPHPRRDAAARRAAPRITAWWSSPRRGSTPDCAPSLETVLEAALERRHGARTR